MKQLLTTTLVIASLSSTSAYADLDKDSAIVRMNVALFASITNLDDFVLKTKDADSSAGAIYQGYDMFNLESNGQVHVRLEGSALTNGNDILKTAYQLNDAGMEFDTAAKSVHKEEHKVSATAKLGDISSQLAGDYAGEIKITVSAI